MFDVDAISLDLDDTLWPVKPVIIAAERAMRDFLRTQYPAVVPYLNDDALLAARRRAVAAYPDRTYDLTFLRKQVLRELANDAGLDHTLVEPAFAVFDDQRNQVDFYPGALSALQAIASRYKVIGCSNGNADLERIGIAGHFHAHVCARSAGAAKPDARIFSAVAAAAGVFPERILHIGDHADADVRGALAAGMQALWIQNDIAWPDRTPQPATLRCIADLPESGLLDL